MKKDKFFAIGVMSGTSFDGIDISLISSDGKKYFKPIISSFYKFSSNIRQKLFYISDNFDENQYKLGSLNSIEFDFSNFVPGGSGKKSIPALPIIKNLLLLIFFLI